MMSRAIYQKRRGRRLLTTLAAGALVAGTLLTASSALAVHDDGLFQLDRNAFTNDTIGDPYTGHDWDQVYADRADEDCTVSGADACSFETDASNTTIFTSGGSKDDLDTTGWKHKNGSVPPKDDLLHGFAARYGDNVYFGTDRIEGSGTATLGVWFFQENVAPVAGGTFGPGKHKNGDILVLTDFQASGENATVRIYEWHSPGGAIGGTL